MALLREKIDLRQVAIANFPKQNTRVLNNKLIKEEKERT